MANLDNVGKALGVIVVVVVLAAAVKITLHKLEPQGPGSSSTYYVTEDRGRPLNEFGP